MTPAGRAPELQGFRRFPARMSARKRRPMQAEPDPRPSFQPRADTDPHVIAQLYAFAYDACTAALADLPRDIREAWPNVADMMRRIPGQPYHRSGYGDPPDARAIAAFADALRMHRARADAAIATREGRPVVQVSRYGKLEIGAGGFDGARRVDRWVPNDGTKPVMERTFVTGPDDRSERFRAHYGRDLGHAPYDSRCSGCYLGFSHSVEKHARETR